MLSRLDDKRTGAIVIVMQRVHMDDLTGFVTGQSDEWEVLNLPAIAEVDEDIPISDDESPSARGRRGAFAGARTASVLENLKASTRQRRVLGPVPANAGPARRRHDQARLDQALYGTASAKRTLSRALRI